MSFYRFMAEAGFFLFVAFIVYGGYVAMWARNLMISVLGLALTLLGIGGLFFYLGSQFLALMQLLISIGGVCVIIAFGVMVGPKPKQEAEKRIIGKRNANFAICACSAGVLLFTLSMVGARWTPAPVRSGDFSVKYLGNSLLNQFCLSFEFISLLLLVAIIGALIISGIGREE